MFRFKHYNQVQPTDQLYQDPLNITQPVQKRPVPTPDLTKEIQIKAEPNATGNLVFYVDDSQFRANFSETPLLLAASNGVTEFPGHPEYNIHNYADANQIRLIIYNSFPVTHTMHLHGHADFWILDEGIGQWDGKIVQAENPQRRDSAQMRMGFPGTPSYLVIQFAADNPGVWSLHCHVVIHVSAGLYMNIIEHPDKIKKNEYREVMERTCTPWKEFVKTNPPPQFDSGLRLKERNTIERSLEEVRRIYRDAKR